MEIRFELDLLKLNVTPLQALTLSLVDNLKESGGVCWLSHKEIAEILNIARPNASRCIAALCNAGYLEKTDGGRGIKLIPTKAYQNDTYQNDTPRIKMIPKTYQNDTENQEKERKQEKENFPPHPLYKEKEINKEKEANAMTAINIIGENAHTREEQQSAAIVPRETSDDKTTSELIAIDQHAKRHPLMLEQFCMNNYITPAVFAKLANEVATEWTLKGVTHANIADARQHFFNTIRLRAAELRRDQPKQRPLKLTWLPNEPLTLPADATDEERAAFLAEVDRRDKEYHKNDNDLPF